MTGGRVASKVPLSIYDYGAAVAGAGRTLRVALGSLRIGASLADTLTAVRYCRFSPRCRKLILVTAPGSILWQSSHLAWSSGEGSRRYSRCSGRQFRRLGGARPRWARVWPLSHQRSRRTGRRGDHARSRDEPVVHLPDGRTSRKNFAKGWAARLFRR